MSVSMFACDLVPIPLPICSKGACWHSAVRVSAARLLASAMKEGDLRPVWQQLGACEQLYGLVRRFIVCCRPVRLCHSAVAAVLMYFSRLSFLFPLIQVVVFTEGNVNKCSRTAACADRLLVHKNTRTPHQREHMASSRHHLYNINPVLNKW